MIILAWEKSILLQILGHLPQCAFDVWRRAQEKGGVDSVAVQRMVAAEATDEVWALADPRALFDAVSYGVHVRSRNNKDCGLRLSRVQYCRTTSTEWSWPVWRSTPTSVVLCCCSWVSQAALIPVILGCHFSHL